MDRNAFIKECFRLAKEKGFESSELFFKSGKDFSLKVVDGEIGGFDLSETGSVSFKGIYQGKMGRCFSEIIDESTAKYLVEKAYEAALYIEDEDEVFIYEGDEVYPKLKLFNPELEKVSLDRKIDFVLDLEKQCLAEEGVTKLQSVGYSESASSIRIVNSLGLDISEDYNLATASVSGMGQKDGKNYMAYHYDYEMDFDRLLAKSTAKTFGEKVREQFGADQVESGSYQVVLSPEAATSLLWAFDSMFSAESVQKDLSPLKGKLGQKIAADIITLVDHPHLEDRLGSQSFDTDGVATKVKTLVDKGELKTYLHNLKTAKKDGVVSTGNASGSGVASSNLYIEPGTMSEEELLKEVGSGLYIRNFDGLHAGTNSVSGDFSLQCDGALFEEGRVTQPFSQVVLSGNILDVLKSCYLLANNLEFPGGSMGSPTMAVGELKLAGK